MHLDFTNGTSWSLHLKSKSTKLTAWNEVILMSYLEETLKNLILSLSSNLRCRLNLFFDLYSFINHWGLVCYSDRHSSDTWPKRWTLLLSVWLYKPGCWRDTRSKTKEGSRQERREGGHQLCLYQQPSLCLKIRIRPALDPSSGLMPRQSFGFF